MTWFSQQDCQRREQGSPVQQGQCQHEAGRWDLA